MALCALTGTFQTRSVKLWGCRSDGRSRYCADCRARCVGGYERRAVLTTATVTLSLDSSWATSTVYAVGDRVTNGISPARIYQATVTGTSAALVAGRAVQAR